jgi:hypothetical protein
MVVVEGDGPAHHDQSVLGHAAEGGVEDATADLVEIDVDPVRAQFLKPGGQAVQQSKPSSSTTHAHFSSEPTTPTTRHPWMLVARQDERWQA